MVRIVAGVMSGAERVVVGVGVDADDTSRDDGVDVTLLSSPSHIVEQVEGNAELRFSRALRAQPLAQEYRGWARRCSGFEARSRSSGQRPV
jgi:hypothetical protein